VILLRSVCSRDDDHSMFAPTKATSLNSHLSAIPKPAKARVEPLASRFDVLEPDRPPPHRFRPADVPPLLMSLLCVGFVTAVLFLLDQKLAHNLVPVAYLIPVIIAATQWGIWPATLASVAGTGAADFFFFPPYYSFQVDDPQEAVDLMLFLVVALVSSNLASRLRRETEALRQREKEIQQLYDFSRRLAACFTVSDLISAIQNYLSRALGQQATVFAAMADGHFDPPKSVALPKAVQDGVASMIARIGVAAHSIVDEPTQNVWLIRAVCSETTVHGLVAVNIGSGPRRIVDSRTRQVEDILEEVSLTLQRLDIERAMEDARLHLQAQLLRDAFHGTLSHELRSPLAAIRGSASVLDSMPAIRGDQRIHSLVEAISDEVAELDGFIQNLLSATRVSAGGLSPRLEWADPRDIVDAAIRRSERRLSAHRIEISFAEDLPLVHVDSGLIEESLGQLLDNAAKYSPSGSTISVSTRTERERVVFSVADQGVGITADEKQQLGRRSFRSPRHQTTVAGSGLGFWIASTFVRANGGTIEMSSRGDGLGATASITLPAPRTSASGFIHE
jgi:K+-sensing histidine kinase KdpD